MLLRASQLCESQTPSRSDGIVEGEAGQGLHRHERLAALLLGARFRSEPGCLGSEMEALRVWLKDVHGASLPEEIPQVMPPENSMVQQEHQQLEEREEREREERGKDMRGKEGEHEQVKEGEEEMEKDQERHRNSRK